MVRSLRTTAAVVLGWMLVVGGIALLALPGPGLFVLVAGVALLAPHHRWARRILDPLRARAIAGAKAGVRTRRHIALSVAGALWLLGFGVVWLVGPRIPVVEMWGLRVGPDLPGGTAAGIGMVVSGLIAIALLAYSVHRWYPADAAPAER